MRISLRTKTILLMLVTLACTAGPLMYMSLRHSQESVKENYQTSMADILQLAEHTIASNFSEILHIKAIAISGERNVMESNTRLATALLRQLRDSGWSRERCAALLQSLCEDGQIVVVQQDGSTWDSKTSGLFGELAEDPSRLRFLLDVMDNLSESEAEEFINFVTSASSILAYVIPVPKENAAIITLHSLTPTIDLIEDFLKNLRKNTGEALDSLQTLGDDGGVFALHTDPLRPFSDRDLPFSPEALPMIEQALRENKTSLTVPSETGPMLCELKNMPLHHIVLLAAVSEETLNSSLHELALQQGSFFALILLAGTGLAVLFSGHLISPLARFSSVAKALPQNNFEDDAPQQTVALPVTRKDEIGDLARSFVEMEALLRGTVHRLVQTATDKERLESELNVAREIQEGILPKIFPPFPTQKDVSMYASLGAAREMGGDLYDFFFVDDQTLCVAIGDVSGKGVPAALFMSITVTLIRATMRPGVSPEVGMALINNALASNNPQDMFVSLFLGLYNPHTGDLRFSVGGHPLPVRIGPKRCEPLECAEPDMVLGLFPDLPYRGLSTRLEPEEGLFLYTDGVTEATSETKDFYGEDRLLRMLRRCPTLSEKDTVRAVAADLNRFVGSAAQADDITMLVLRRSVVTPGASL